MRLHSRRLPVLTGLCLLALVSPNFGQTSPDAVLPDAEYPKMVQYTVKGIKDALKSGKPKEEQVNKAKTAAVMIAAYAQQNLTGADGQQRATVRDAAIKLADAIAAKQFAAAVKQAEDLAALPADPKAKKERVKLMDVHVRVSDLMQQFKRPPDGGWGIDSKLYAYRLGMKSAIPTSDLRDQLMFEAYQVAVTADLINSKVPTMKDKEWAAFTGDLRKGAVQLAEAVKKKDGGAALDAVGPITSSCTGCHKAFRASK